MFHGTAALVQGFVMSLNVYQIVRPVSVIKMEFFVL